MGPRASLQALEKRKISIPCQESNPDYFVVHPVLSLLYDLSYLGF
jgi:hypothetical protein